MIHLRGVSADVVIDDVAGVPVVVYWGAPLGDVEPSSLAAALARPAQQGSIDVVAPISLVPEHGAGFQGRPGLQGHRQGGSAWAPRFAPAGTTAHRRWRARWRPSIPWPSCAWSCTVTLDDVLAVACTVVNEGDTRYLLDALHPTLPLPGHASRAAHVRRALDPRAAIRCGATGAVARSSPRTAPDAPRTSTRRCCSPGRPGSANGAARCGACTWPGAATTRCSPSAMPDGRRYVQGGELLHPGELCLEPGESYTAPPVLGVYAATGLTPASWGFHRCVPSLAVALRRGLARCC